MIYNLLSILTNTCIVRFTFSFLNSERKMFNFSSILITISRSLGQYKKFPILSNYFYFFPNELGAFLHSSLKKQMPKNFHFRILLTLCVFYLLNLNPIFFIFIEISWRLILIWKRCTKGSAWISVYDFIHLKTHIELHSLILTVIIQWKSNLRACFF